MPMIRCPVCNQTYDVESSLIGHHDFYAEKHLLGFIHLGLSFLSGIASAVMRESCPEAMIVSYIWAIVEIFAIKKDGKGIPLK